MSGGAARLRLFSMKRTVSQQSFDGISLDSSGPEDRISVDSDGSDSFVMLLEAGMWQQSPRGLQGPGSVLTHSTCSGGAKTAYCRHSRSQNKPGCSSGFVEIAFISVS